MVKRSFWLKQIENALKKRSVVWLSGVRRVGKTRLCQSLDDIEYFDCERPRIRSVLVDPEAFLAQHRGKRLVLDEIHRLENPSEVLKIAADYFPDTQIIATGSSQLTASAKFKDSLAGRKYEVWLTPMVFADLLDFQSIQINHRMLSGGLPPFFLSSTLQETLYKEWIEAYWATDIQELFRLEKRRAFHRLLELLLLQSGGIFDATRFAKLCEISRPTVNSYVAILEATFVVHVIRPFSSHRATEIVAAPKIYGFDTGFISYFRGWSELRQEDKGHLWEHIVLNELHAHLQTREIQYWRDKSGREVDFVVRTKRNGPPIAIECKWSHQEFSMDAMRAFRQIYPDGSNFVVAQDVDVPFHREHAGVKVNYVNAQSLIEKLLVAN